MPIRGKPILWYSIQNLLAVGVEEFCFVVGHKAPHIRRFVHMYFPHMKAIFITNHKYKSTLCGYSFYKAIPFFRNHDFFELVGDIIYSKSILQKLMRANRPIVYAVQPKTTLAAEEYPAIINSSNKTFVTIGSGARGAQMGEVKGIGFIRARSSNLIATAATQVIRRNPSEYSDTVYQWVIEHGTRVYYVSVGKRDFWAEIDTKEEYRLGPTYLLKAGFT